MLGHAITGTAAPRSAAALLVALLLAGCDSSGMPLRSQQVGLLARRLLLNGEQYSRLDG